MHLQHESEAKDHDANVIDAYICGTHCLLEQIIALFNMFISHKHIPQI